MYTLDKKVTSNNTTYNYYIIPFCGDCYMNFGMKTSFAYRFIVIYCLTCASETLILIYLENSIHLCFHEKYSSLLPLVK